jgi:hypothetical protein
MDSKDVNGHTTTSHPPGTFALRTDSCNPALMFSKTSSLFAHDVHVAGSLALDGEQFPN